ncbi:SF1B family DNA helicase RecD2 [Granulicatella seriolae]|uniref:ATP-dependent RecD2 DNA helicase n=1 Tax=Granulicatella seriolae TaxID=2967226 RepID=A0ABT1WRS8_9LACT|nr:ATP-dependent RecD-like DNA helicase [Granulicatella seriolae]
MESENFIVGQIKTFFYENPTNFYKVCLIDVEESNLTLEKNVIVVTGTFGQLHEDVSYRFLGQLVSHPKYGQQFSASSYQQAQPTGKTGLISYFSSERFPGIGKKTAERIVDLLGIEAIDRIIEDENALNGIPGLNKRKQNMMRETIIQNQGSEKTRLTLINYGFSFQLAQKIINTFKGQTLDILNEDPYLFMYSVKGIGFKRIDALAEQMNISADSMVRLKGAVYYVLREICFQYGHTYLYKNDLLMHTQTILEQSRSYIIELEQIEEAIMELVREGKVIVDKDRLALFPFFYSEIGIASSLERLKAEQSEQVYSEEKIKRAIKSVEKENGIHYGDSQVQSIIQAIQSPIFILTGGPGTGKTTVINGIVSVFCQLNHIDLNKKLRLQEPLPILLAAPTGRAAKRMSETTSMPASTIHRLLGMTGEEDEMDLDEFHELEGDLLIIDEMSMVDTWLMNRLLKAVPTNMQILFVGDKNQLPSVGPGQVLSDLLASGEIPQVELTEIYRQEASSTIISLAHQMKDGRLPDDFRQRTSDRSFIPSMPQQILSVVEQVIKKAVASGYSKRDIQVLAPMYKGEAGIDAINTLVQNLLNPLVRPGQRQVEHFDRIFRVGDKVLQLVNQAEQNVFNGDMGEIVAIQFANENEDKTDKLFVAFDQTEVEYARNDWQQLTLAYCCSIHKAQGSEFRLVILPMLQAYSRMLRRNLVYTAVTRAKETLILCGQYQAFSQAVSQVSDVRQTLLKEFIMAEEENDLGLEMESLSTSPNQADTRQPKISEKNSPIENSIELENQPDVNKSEDKQDKQLPSYLTENMVMMRMVDPMIGMEDLSPYDFMSV